VKILFLFVIVWSLRSFPFDAVFDLAVVYGHGLPPTWLPSMCYDWKWPRDDDIDTRDSAVG